MAAGPAANPYIEATFGNYMSGHAQPCEFHFGFSLVPCPVGRVVCFGRADQPRQLGQGVRPKVTKV